LVSDGPGHTSPLLHQIWLFGESEKSSLSPSTDEN
jgi:hypothetical protein